MMMMTNERERERESVYVYPNNLNELNTNSHHNSSIYDAPPAAAEGGVLPTLQLLSITAKYHLFRNPFSLETVSTYESSCPFRHSACSCSSATMHHGW